MSQIQQVSQHLPSSPSPSIVTRILSWLPWKFYFLLAVAGWWYWGTQEKKPSQLKRRTAQKSSTPSSSTTATPRRPRPSVLPTSSSQRLSSSTHNAHPLSRRSSAVWGPSPSNSNRNSPAPLERRGLYRSASGYGSSLRLSGLARQQQQEESGSEYGVEDNGYEVPSSSIPYLPPSTLSRATPLGTSHLILPHSPALKRSFETDSNAGQSTLGAPGKRSRFDDEVEFEDEEDTPMELDELAEATNAARGVKRGAGGRWMSGKKGSGKRSRRTEEEEEEEAEEDVEERVEGGGAGRKRRASERRSSWGEELEEEGGKRVRRREPVGSKRGVEEVEQSSEEELLEEESDAPRNADSDVEEEDVDEGEEAEEQEEEKPRKRITTGREGSKRARSTSVREGSDDDDLMGDDASLIIHDDVFSSTSSTTTPRSVVSSPRKRISTVGGTGKKNKTSRKFGSTLLGKKELVNSMQKGRKASELRKVGEEWVNLEGDKCRLGEDGKVRKLCEVREWRKKYKMPKDSLHPDAKLTHEVIVERWLTNEEYATLLEERKLAWQSKEDELTDKEGDMNVDGVGSVTETSEVEEIATKSKGLYTTDNGTPLGSHFPLSLLRPYNSPTLLPRSPSLTLYGNSSPARLRLPSNLSSSNLSGLGGGIGTAAGGGGGTPAIRSWSSGSKLSRNVEEKQRERRERERRKGGEGEKEDPLSGKIPTKTETVAVEEPKLRLEDFAKSQVELTTTTVPATATVEKKEPAATIPNFFAKPAAAVAEPAKDESTAPKFEAPKLDAPKPSSIPNFFASSTPAAVVEKKVEPPAPAPAATSSLFSFGAPKPVVEQKKEEPKAVAASAAPSPFSFGTPDSTTPGATTEAPKPAPSFSFGAPASISTPTNAPKPASSFSFGTPSSSSAPPAAVEAPKPSFSFGTPSSTVEPPKPTGIALGSITFVGAPQANKPTEAPKPSPFAFSAPSNPPSAAAASAPFSFGNPAPSASLPTASTTPSPSPFSFGAPPPSASQPPASASPFSFGAPPPPATQQPPSSGFSFGAPAVASPVSATSSGGFSFGQAASTTPSAAGAGGGFSFGAPVAVAATSPAPGGLFSFGSGGGETSDGGASSLGRRRIAGAPRAKR